MLKVMWVVYFTMALVVVCVVKTVSCHPTSSGYHRLMCNAVSSVDTTIKGAPNKNRKPVVDAMLDGDGIPGSKMDRNSSDKSIGGNKGETSTEIDLKPEKESELVESSTKQPEISSTSEKVATTVNNSLSEVSPDPKELPQLRITVFAYSDFGEPKTDVVLKDNCVNLERNWLKRVSSVNTHGDCILLCQYRNCLGSCIRVAPGTPNHNRLRLQNFDKRTSSLKRCYT